MFCYVYRSDKKTGAYLYLSKEDDFDCLPEAMLQLFGTPRFSLSFNLTPDRKLAQADAQTVLDQLKSEGYFLQLPKTDYDISVIEKKIIQSLQNG